MRRSLLTLLVLMGAFGPLFLAVAVASLIAPGPVAVVAALSFSVALNALRPLGGGMVIQGTYRTRFQRREWTDDTDRDPSLGARPPVLMALVTSGPFFLATPLVSLAIRAVSPLPIGVIELVALVGVMVLAAAAVFGQKRELPIWRWRQELEAGTHDTSRLAAEVEALAAIALPSGAIGHVGGIGAGTIGLHELLDAERVLRAAEDAAIAGAAGLRRGALAFLAKQALPEGGFPVYPGAAGRLSLTVRAVEALGPALSAEEIERHAAFVRRCAILPGGFGRSPGQPLDEEESARARPFLARLQAPRAAG